jgi:hypothetical protein
MTPLTCKVVRRMLEPYHDDELPVGEQIAVGVHLDYCDACAEALEDLRALRGELRHSGVARLALTAEEADVFEMSVVNRAQVEASASFSAWVHDLFDDMHLVYAGISAAVATLVFASIMFGTLRLATTVRPDSLGAIVSILSSPGSNENPVTNYGRVQLPRVLDVVPSTHLAIDDDAVFALAATVTREGRISGVEFLHARGGKSVRDSSRINGVMNAASQARFEPAVSDSGPVAVNMVWLVANTTVRPRVEERAEDVRGAEPVPEAEKPTAESVAGKNVA